MGDKELALGCAAGTQVGSPIPGPSLSSGGTLENRPNSRAGLTKLYIG